MSIWNRDFSKTRENDEPRLGDSLYLRRLSVVRRSNSLKTVPFLLLDERSLKDRPEIKIDLVGPPKAPAVFIFLPDWQLKQ